MLTGAILAGGQNRRMRGKPKALLPFPSQSLIERQIAVISSICSEIIVVTNDPKPLLPQLDRSVRLITDFYPNQGPLAGIHAALSLAGREKIWVVACDMPFLSAAAARLLWYRLVQKDNSEAAVPYIEGRLYPLFGIYRKTCAKTIADLLENGQRRLSNFLMSIPLERVDEPSFSEYGIDPGFVTDINTPEQYGQALCNKKFKH